MTLRELLEKHSFLSQVKEPFIPVVGREDELHFLEESMYKKRMKNSILVGDAGCGKTAIIEEFARRTNESMIILNMDIGSCISGTCYRGDYEKKLTDVFRDIIGYNMFHKSRPIVIFIDEIHTIMHSGDTEGGISTANIMKPYLSNRDITIIGATTMVEYKKWFSNDSAMTRRLSPIFIGKLKKEVVLSILNDFSDGKLNKQLLEYIYDCSETLKGCNPDISLEVLDRCMARKKRTKQKITLEMIENIVDYMSECNNLQSSYAS